MVKKSLSDANDQADIRLKHTVPILREDPDWKAVVRAVRRIEQMDRFSVHAFDHGKMPDILNRVDVVDNDAKTLLLIAAQIAELCIAQHDVAEFIFFCHFRKLVVLGETDLLCSHQLHELFFRLLDAERSEHHAHARSTAGNVGLLIEMGDHGCDVWP